MIACHSLIISLGTQLCLFDIKNKYTNSETHAQRIIGSGVIIPEELEHPSCWYYGM
jgi:hypothetical protein